MISRLACALCLLASAVACAEDAVSLQRVPQGGMKPSLAVDDTGAVHLVYFKGEPRGGDAFYAASRDGGATWSDAVRVNSQAGSVLGVSSIRGPRLALGRGGRVHVVWNGSSVARPKAPLNPAMPADSPFNGTPLLYARLDAVARTFEPQRNLMARTCALDGGADVAADAEGRVFAVWHAMLPGAKSEADRAVWIARSADDGRTFSEETNVLPTATGACGCCALAARAGEGGALAILYRGATESVHRGMHLLISRDRGATFASTSLADWNLAACPMSHAALLPRGADFLAASERAGTVWLTGLAATALAADERTEGQKYPALAMNARGDLLLAWTEGMGWNKGGALAWKIFPAGKLESGAAMHRGTVPAHGSAAAFTRPDGTFVLMY